MVEWTPLVSFFADGTPKAQPRPRAFARKMGATFVARVYDAGTAEGWKSEIAIAARQHRPAAPLAGALKVNLKVFLPRPKYMLTKKSPDGPIKHTAKPDVDNLSKAILDCLKTLGFFTDDAIISDHRVRKWYVARGGRTGAEIEIGPDPEVAAVAQATFTQLAT